MGEKNLKKQENNVWLFAITPHSILTEELIDQVCQIKK